MKEKDPFTIEILLLIIFFMVFSQWFVNG